MSVNSDHYRQLDRPECWDWLIENFGLSFVAAWDALTACKYKYRAGEKTGESLEDDNQKMDDYLLHAHKLLLRISTEAPDDFGRTFDVIQTAVRLCGKDPMHTD